MMPPSNPVPTALDRTRSSLGYLFAGLRWLATVLATGVVTLLGWTGAGLHRLGAAVAGLRGPVVRVVRGPLAALVLGRRAAVSVILAGGAPVLAVLTAGLVATTVGYHPLERWLVGTWTGTDPRVAVFVGAALLGPPRRSGRRGRHRAGGTGPDGRPRRRPGLRRRRHPLRNHRVHVRRRADRLSPGSSRHRGRRGRRRKRRRRRRRLPAGGRHPACRPDRPGRARGG